MMPCKVKYRTTTATVQAVRTASAVRRRSVTLFSPKRIVRLWDYQAVSEHNACITRMSQCLGRIVRLVLGQMALEEEGRWATLTIP